MKIKHFSNSKVTCFDFKFDISKGNTLKNVLDLFEIKEMFLCIYGLRIQEDNFIASVKNKFTHADLLSYGYAFELTPSDLDALFSIVTNKYDELVVYSKFTDWNLFIKERSNISDVVESSQPRFYLNFSPYDFNVVEIICDNPINNNVTLNDLQTIFC